MQDKCKLVLAGPGTGKTYGMISEITRNLSDLDPHRFLAAVTYTNAAAEIIRNRIQERLILPENVFIGTTHSFFNKFILKPYARLYDLAPVDTMFIDGIDIQTEFTGENAFLRERSFKSGIANDLAKKGIVCHDKTIQFSRDLLKKKTILNEIANRLQMVFVDEYQDANVVQGSIFEALAATGKIKMFFVGDPEQYIYSFGYRKSLIPGKTPDFANIPIMKLQKELGQSVRTKTENKRSNQKIVSFINNFNSQEKQVASESAENGEVIFINRQEIQEIINAFHKICADKNKELKISDRLYLSYAKDTLATVAETNDLRQISNDQISDIRLVGECLKYISVSRGKSQKDIRLQKNIGLIEWRKLGIRILTIMLKNPKITKEQFDATIISEVDLDCDIEKNCQSMFDRLANVCQIEKEVGHCYSTIHKAKGLEADAVLVICDTETKMKKWLENDQGKRFDDKNDECRLGFVAFSRAKKLLCIGCLKTIADHERIFDDLNVKIV